MSPEAIVVRERVVDGPTRRIVFDPRSDGRYERREQLWRLAIAGWHTTGTEIVADVTIDHPEADR